MAELNINLRHARKEQIDSVAKMLISRELETRDMVRNMFKAQHEQFVVLKTEIIDEIKMLRALIHRSVPVASANPAVVAGQRAPLRRNASM